MAIAGADKNRKFVLGVDDQASNRALLEAILTTAGYGFLAAASGPDCLAIIAMTVPRLVLLDIQMPEMDGFATCRAIRAQPTLQSVPIAFLTASKRAEDVSAGLAAGGNDFIVKPFDAVKLLNRVAYWTNRRAVPTARDPKAGSAA